MEYDTESAEAYGALELLTTFMVRYHDVASDTTKGNIRKLFKAFCGTDRYLEATGEQFMTALDHW